MLEWAQATGSPSLALLIDHDDAEREFHYTSTAQTFAETEPITDVGARLGWTVVSMARDWDVVFPPVSGSDFCLRGYRQHPVRGAVLVVTAITVDSLGGGI
jgi:hypothetical protein